MPANPLMSWNGRQVLDESHIAELEQDSFIRESQGMDRASASSAVYNDYLKKQRLQAAAYHLKAQKAAQASGNQIEAQKHQLSYGIAVQAMGYNPYGPPPQEILAASQDPNLAIDFKFKPHPADAIMGGSQPAEGGAMTKNEIGQELHRFITGMLAKAEAETPKELTKQELGHELYKVLKKATEVLDQSVHGGPKAGPGCGGCGKEVPFTKGELIDTKLYHPDCKKKELEKSDFTNKIQGAREQVASKWQKSGMKEGTLAAEGGDPRRAENAEVDFNLAAKYRAKNAKEMQKGELTDLEKGTPAMDAVRNGAAHQLDMGASSRHRSWNKEGYVRNERGTHTGNGQIAPAKSQTRHGEWGVAGKVAAPPAGEANKVAAYQNREDKRMAKGELSPNGKCSACGAESKEKLCTPCQHDSYDAECEAAGGITDENGKKMDFTKSEIIDGLKGVIANVLAKAAPLVNYDMRAELKNAADHTTDKYNVQGPATGNFYHPYAPLTQHGWQMARTSVGPAALKKAPDGGTYSIHQIGSRHHVIHSSPDGATITPLGIHGDTRTANGVQLAVASVAQHAAQPIPQGVGPNPQLLRSEIDTIQLMLAPVYRSIQPLVKDDQRQEHNIKISRSMGGKKFIDEQGNVYETLGQAAAQLGLQASHIDEVLHGRRQQAAGHTFKYMDA